MARVQVRAGSVAVATVVVLGVVCGVAPFVGPAAAGPAGMAGSGTAGDPYEVTNAAQLQAMNQDLGAHYELVADVDASSIADFEPIGSTYDSGFDGSFDGNGHVVDGLTMDRSPEYTGLFGVVHGDVTRAALTNVDIDGVNRVGGVAGRNEGTVAESTVTGTINGSVDVGGLVGGNEGVIRDSFTPASLTVTGGEDVGGIVGSNYITVERTYSAASVSGTDAGGVAGFNYGSLTGSYWNTAIVSDPIGKVYVDGDGPTDLTGLSAVEMTGTAALDAMPALSWGSVVTVREPTAYPGLAAVHVTDVALTLDSTAVSTDETTNAAATVTVDATTTVTDDRNVVYASDDTAVATVTGDGTVTAKGVGEAAIRATAGQHSATRTVTVPDDEAPTADATLQGGGSTAETGAAVTFDGTGSLDNVGVVSYDWNFDDGGVGASGATVAHTFDATGAYDVVLTTADDAGHTDTDTLTVTVEDTTDPHADAGGDRMVEEDTAVSFDGSGSMDAVGVTSYEWDFDDGTTATGASPSHTFTDPGAYTVGLTVEDDAGNTGTDTATVTVQDVTAPGAVAATASGSTTLEVGNSVAFDGTGSTDNDDVVGFAWDFGDGTTASGATPTQSYADTGTYTVELTVADGAGHTDLDSLDVTVVDTTEPVADAGADQTVSEDEPVRFDGTGSTDNHGIATYGWDFDDGNAASGSSPTHTYSQPGTYEVELTAEDDAANANTDSVDVLVQDVTSPTADAGDDLVVDEDTPVTFDGTGSIDNVGVVSWGWDLDDGNETTGKTPTHTFVQPGTYEVELTAEDDAGNTATDQVDVTVADTTDPVADAGGEQTVDEDSVLTFDAGTTTDNAGVDSYNWEFGDGNETTTASSTVDHTYVDPGTYEATLTVEDAAGNADTDEIPVTVSDVTDPTADAGSNDTVRVRGSVTFDASNSTDNGAIASYEWEFGDGTETETGNETVEYAYNSTGTHRVTLSVTDQAGNEATDSVTIGVQPRGGSGGGGGSSALGDFVRRQTGTEDDEPVRTDVDDAGRAIATVALGGGQTVELDLGDAFADEDAGVALEAIHLRQSGDRVRTLSFVGEQLSALPADTPPLGDGEQADGAGDDASALTYADLSVTSDGGDASADVDSATVEFTVEADRLEDLAVERGDVALYRFDGEAETWETIETTADTTADGRVVYRAPTTGFSVVAVGYQTGESAPPSGTTTPTDADSPTETPAAGATPEPETTGADGPGFGPVVPIIPLLAVAAFYRRQ